MEYLFMVISNLYFMDSKLKIKVELKIFIHPFLLVLFLIKKVVSSTSIHPSILVLYGK